MELTITNRKIRQEKTVMPFHLELRFSMSARNSLTIIWIFVLIILFLTLITYYLVILSTSAFSFYQDHPEFPVILVWIQGLTPHSSQPDPLPLQDLLQISSQFFGRAILQDHTFVFVQ